MDRHEIDPVDLFERTVRLESSAASAHKRLDGYNGQIRELTNTIAAMKIEFGGQMTNVRIEVAKLSVKTGVVAAIGAMIGTAVVGGIVTAVLAATGAL